MKWNENRLHFRKPGPHFSCVITKVIAVLFNILTWKKLKCNCIIKGYCIDWSKDVTLLFISTCLPHIHYIFLFPSQTPTCCGTSSWQRWRWARVDSGNERAAKRPRANPRPFHPPDPSTFVLTSTLPLSTSSIDSWWQHSLQTEETDPIIRQRWIKTGDISSAVCKPDLLFLLFPLLLPLSPSGAVVPLPRRRQSSKLKKTTKNKENAVLYSYETVNVVEWKRSFKTYIWIMDICVI